MVSEIMGDALSQGTTGREGLRLPWSGELDADKTATAFAFHSNQGNLDLHYGHRTLDAGRPDERSPLTIGGAKAEQVFKEAVNQNMKWANKELETKNFQLNKLERSNGQPRG
jgi:hypothetical protein